MPQSQNQAHLRVFIQRRARLVESRGLRTAMPASGTTRSVLRLAHYDRLAIVLHTAVRCYLKLAHLRLAHPSTCAALSLLSPTKVAL